MCWRWGTAAAFNNCDYKRSEGGGRESTQCDQGVLDLDGRERFIDDEEVDSGRRAGVAAAVWVAGGSGTGVSRKSSVSWLSREAPTEGG